MADETHSQIDALLKEDRQFAPSAEFVRAAHVSDPAIYEAGRQRPGRLLGEIRRRARVDQAVGQGARLEPAAREVVRRRKAERQRQLPRPPRPHVAQEQGRDHLGRRARRQAHADVLGAPSRGLPVRKRPALARDQERRSHRDLPAADPRARHRDARLRAHRRHPQRRLWRLQRRVAARSHQRPAGAPPHHRRRRLSARQRGPVEARRGRSGGRHAVDREGDRRAAAYQSVRRGTEGRPRSLVPRPDAQGHARRRARGDGRRGHALHPLHLRHHGEAQGHRPHDWRLSHRRLRDDEVGVRPQGRGRLLVHGRHRLGHGPQLRRLRAAGQRRDGA